MNNTKTRTAIRVYAHQLKVIGYTNSPAQGIVHYTDGCSRMWCDGNAAWLDRETSECFLDEGLSETQARKLLVAMLKAAIAEHGLETKN